MQSDNTLDLIKQANASVSLEFLSHSEPEETKEFVDREKRFEYEDMLPKTKTSNSGTTMQAIVEAPVDEEKSAIPGAKVINIDVEPIKKSTLIPIEPKKKSSKKRTL